MNRHGKDIASFAMSFDEPLDWTMFGLWLTMLLNRPRRAGAARQGHPRPRRRGRPVAVHGVQHLVHPPRHMAAWPDGNRRRGLVFIARGLDPA